MITLQDLTFSYRSTHLFQGMNLTFETGSIYGLLGKNGQGKTTLLKLICGLLTPQGGRSLIDGQNPQLRTPDVLSELFLLPEEFELPPMTVLNYGAAYGRFYPQFSEAKFAELLREFEVPLNQKFNKMSLGQRKKGYICFALACQTPILLMDEPTNGLDIPSKSIFRRIISREASENRIIIISTHQVRDLEQLIDSIVILEQNEILMKASVAEIGRKLCFSKLEVGQQALYSEVSIHGTLGVTLNSNLDSETTVDIEMFFNAAITNPKQFKQLFR